MRSHSFQDTELKLYRCLNGSPGQVVEGIAILRYPVGLRNRGLITQKTLIRHLFAQFSGYRVETLQVRQWLTGTGRGGVGDSTVPRLKRHKTLFDSRPTVAWPPTSVAWPFSNFFQKIFWLLETSKNVVWQSSDGRVTSDHCRVTDDRSTTFFKYFS